MNYPGCEKKMNETDLYDGFQYWCGKCEVFVYDDQVAKDNPSFESTCSEFNGTLEEMRRYLKIRSFK